MNRFRMYARADRGGTYYWEDTESGRQGSLKTKDHDQAEKLLQAKNETVRQPHLILRIGNQLSQLLRQLPSSGPLFPGMRRLKQKDRSAEFYRRCRLLKLRGISLHSYRHGWAERAQKAGMPERYAQAALGHASKAVHRAYRRGAMVIVPSLEAYEAKAQKIVPFPITAQNGNKPLDGEQTSNA